MKSATFQWNVADFMPWRPVAAVLSGLLLAAAFPPVGASEAAWFALIPLLVVVRYTAPRGAFRAGFLAGLVFWVLNLVWLRRLAAFDTPWLTVLSGWFALAAACAVYTGAFTATCAHLWAGARNDAAPETMTGLRNVGRMLVIAFSWVGFEYLRATLFTGFAWNGLGVSQYRNLPVIQIAEWGGVYAVSAVVVLVNAGLALTVIALVETLLRRGSPPRRFHPELLLALVALVLTFGYGRQRLQALRVAESREPLVSLRYASIQANVPQEQKWSEATAIEVQKKLSDLTERAGELRPDLVIWPETSVPWPLDQADTGRTFLNDLAASVGPLLVGAIEVDNARSRPRYYNSAFLYGADGNPLGVYRKQHLVPFGEYIPLGRVMPFLERFAPLGYSCAPGETGTVMRVGEPAVPFSTLICFEDSIAPLARRAVAQGARLLINQTNDGWFEDTCAAVQHLSQCVFRCVENRVPAVRCANQGVSCVIDWAGRLDASTQGALDRGESPDSLFRVDTVGVPVATYEPTFYTLHGDWPFAIPCAALSVGVLAGGWWRSRSRR